MRKLARWTLAAAAFAGLGAAIVRWPVGNDARNSLIQQIFEQAGIDARISGGIDFSILPYPQIILRRMELRDASGTLRVDAPAAKIRLRLLPLIAWRFEAASLALNNPDIAIDLDSARLGGTSVVARAAANAPPAPGRNAKAAERLGSIIITNGAARIRRSATDENIISLSNADLVFDWRSTGSPAAASGAANWRGERADISAFLADPAAFLRGEASLFGFELKSRLLDLSLDGALINSPRWQFSGALQMAGRNAAALQQFAQIELPLPGPLPDFTASAQARILAGNLSLTGLRLRAGRQDFAGILAWRVQDGRPSLTATLDTLDLDFTANMDSTKLFSPGRAGWSREPFRLAALKSIDFDIRVSAGVLRIGGARLAEAALSALVKDGQLDASLSARKSYGGAFKARFGLTGNASAPLMRAIIQFDGANAAAFLRDSFESDAASGAASGEIELRAAGTNLDALARSAHGAVRLDIADGGLNAADFDQALRLAAAQPQAAQIPRGKTNLRQAQLSGTVEAGVLGLNGTASGPGIALTGSGRISLADMNVDAAMVARRPPGAPAQPRLAAARQTALLVHLRGPWRNVSVAVSAQRVAQDAPGPQP